MTGEEIGRTYLDEVHRQFRGYKRQADGAIEQCTDEDLFRTLDPESNSIAILLQHIVGNQRSRFTDFLTSDGEKPNRNRDQEFEAVVKTREELMRRWEEGWALVFTTLESLTPEDLVKFVTIRGESYSALRAINRQVAHYANHIGQIVFLAKHYRGAAWKTLSIPKGKSNAPEALTAEKREKMLA
jgi:Protein of unknown function (DUF1572)